MDILPAIDLIDGKCVRLVQGRDDRQITYRDDPTAQAAAVGAAGARWLHVVDLEGAKAGRPVNTPAVAAIARQFPELNIELGGGIRNEEAIVQMLEAGVTRLILGSMR